MLRNLTERKKLMEAAKNESFPRKVASFYRYCDIDHPEEYRDHLYQRWLELQILGRVYIAHEGINAQVSVPEHRWEEFIHSLEAFPFLKDIFLNPSVSDSSYAFFKLDVRVRKNLVVHRLDHNPLKNTSPGPHLSPETFHEWVGRNDVVVVDARNHYECEIGRFESALLPEGKTFAQVLPEIKEKLSPLKDKNILMYCTGGIRCEIASAYLRENGFERVYQLQGGIIHYLNQMKAQQTESKFKGSVYVFDERMAEISTKEKLGRCKHCDEPHSVHSNCAYIHCHGLMIQCPSCAEKMYGCCSELCISKKAQLNQARQ